MKRRTVFQLLAFSACALSASGTFASSATVAAQEHERARSEARVYDKDHRDYHVWNDVEDRAYRTWLDTKHFAYRQYSKLKSADRRDYWRYRHEHEGDHPR